MTTDKVTQTEPTPLEVMAKLAGTWAPDSMGNPTTTENQLELFDENMTILEPISLPHGGRHHGVKAYRELQERMRALWEQRIEATDYWQCGEDRVALRIVIAWTARDYGKADSATDDRPDEIPPRQDRRGRGFPAGHQGAPRHARLNNGASRPP